MRLSRLASACSLSPLSAQSPSTVRHPLLWDREFSQHPIYTPEIAVVDSYSVLWVLCDWEEMFRIDEQDQQLSAAQLNLPLSPEDLQETSDYRSLLFVTENVRWYSIGFDLKDV